MKLLKHLNTYWVSYVILLLTGFMLILLLGDSKNYQTWRLMKLEHDNEVLEKQAKKILSETEALKNSLKASRDTLIMLKRQDSLLQIKSDSISVKLNHIKSAYEKVRNRVDKFDSDSLRKYFTELQIP